jgi:hypothetical protein
LKEFCTVCTSVRNDFDLYRSLFETDQRILNLFSAVAPLCFSDICRILKENLYIQFCKITDPAKTGKKANLTTNFIVEEIPWPDTIARRLRDVNGRLISFRQLIEPARSKRIAHIDLPAQVDQWDNLGSFPRGAEIQFLQDPPNVHQYRPIAVAMSTDTHQLVRALEKSVVSDQCCKCTSGERAAAVLDYAGRSA